MLHRNEMVDLGIRVVHDDQGLVPVVVLPHVVLDSLFVLHTDRTEVWRRRQTPLHCTNRTVWICA